MSKSLLSHSYSLYIETSGKRQESRTIAWSNVLKMISKVTIDLNGLDGGLSFGSFYSQQNYYWGDYDWQTLILGEA